MKYPFREAILRDNNGDLSKRWYVEFYVWDVAQSKLVRKRDYDINRSKTREGRIAKASVIIREINEALHQGYVYDSDKSSKVDNQLAGMAAAAAHPAKYKSESRTFQVSRITGNTTLKQAVKHFMKAKMQENGKRSEQAYNTLQRRLFDYLDCINNRSIALKYVNTTFLESFCNYLRHEYGITNNTTLNSYIQMIKALFNYYQSREIIIKNPAKNLAYLQTTVSDKHLPYTDRQAKYVMSYLKEHDPQLYLFCNFVYFSFIRPKELRYLKISHLQKHIIRVPSLTRHQDSQIRHSKNKKTAYVKMLPSLEKLIDAFEIRLYPPKHFIFSTSGRPAKNPVSANFFNTRYRKVLDTLGFSRDHTLYSWKHTGAIHLYEITHDMKLVQMQCRHADIKTTDRYLRGLTLIGNFDQVDMPGF